MIFQSLFFYSCEILLSYKVVCGILDLSLSVTTRMLAVYKLKKLVKAIILLSNFPARWSVLQTSTIRISLNRVIWVPNRHFWISFNWRNKKTWEVTWSKPENGVKSFGLIFSLGSWHQRQPCFTTKTQRATVIALSIYTVFFLGIVNFVNICYLTHDRLTLVLLQSRGLLHLLPFTRNNLIRTPRICTYWSIFLLPHF